jgi:hypothetical protein
MKSLHLPAVIFCLFIAVTVNAQSYTEQLSDLERQKDAAVAAANYKLAGEIKNKIEELKSNPPKLEHVATGNSSIQSQIKELEDQKNKAVEEANFKMAAELKAKITDMKENPSKYQTQSIGTSSVLAQIKELEDQKEKAVANADFKLAAELKDKIDNMKADPSKHQTQSNDNSSVLAQIKVLEDKKAEAVANADYKLAGEINFQIINLKNQSANSTGVSNESLAPRSAVNSNSGTQNPNAYTPSTSAKYSVVNDNTGMRISKSGENEMAGINYRRSSLYSIIRMTTGEEQTQYADVIQEAFINTPIPTKFNNHNLGLRVLPHDAELTNELAKYIVAAWFNRDDRGRFNMELIKERGLYNASSYDINVAQGSARGLKILEDAGEELLGNTFVIVNEFNYTNKEDVANKTKKVTNTIGFLASFIPGAEVVSSAADVANLGLTIAGKGYWIKNTSHLYQLVWNEEIANEFYTKYWVDENNSYDQEKIAAFDTCNLFQLKYVGFENARADLQSSVFTSKSDAELIAKATTKAIDNGIAKLERKFEQFRTKTPLYSVDPTTAKIGLKEGLEPGDKYEVLEQVQDSNGKIEYVRKGVLTVDKKNIWDNTYSAEELVEMGKQPDQNQFTVFKSAGSRFAPGMLIRQIN